MALNRLEALPRLFNQYVWAGFRPSDSEILQIRLQSRLKDGFGNLEPDQSTPSRKARDFGPTS